MQSLFQMMCCAFCFKSKKTVKNGEKICDINEMKIGDHGASFKNNKSMRYKLVGEPNEELATFGAGCYWGTEKWFIKRF